MLADVFHHTNKFYEIGEVIQLGNWGRVVRGYGAFHRFWVREQTWEQVRSQNFSDRPSRLECSYAYDDLNTALKGRADGNPPFLPWIYEVEPVDEGCSRHQGDLWFMNYGAWEAQADVPQGVWNVPAFLSLASRYWAGELPSGESEILLGSDLRVTGIAARGEAVPYLPKEQTPPGIEYEQDSQPI